MLGITEPIPFISYWLIVGCVAAATAMVLVRRQALQAHEPVWSPPTRRVVQSALPALGTGFLLGLVVLVRAEAVAGRFPGLELILAHVWLPTGWAMLYGCAVHAAGSVLPRGMKLFGFALIMGGSLVLLFDIPTPPTPWFGHLVMGFFFGILHQAYGMYLYLTEEKERPT
jgi:hypothetical protein